MSATGTASSDQALSPACAPLAGNADWCPDSAPPTLTRSAYRVAIVVSQAHGSRGLGMSWNSSGINRVVTVERPASTRMEAGPGIASSEPALGRRVTITGVAAPATTGTGSVVAGANPENLGGDAYAFTGGLCKRGLACGFAACTAAARA